MIRDSTVKQLFTAAKTYHIFKSKVEAASKLTPVNDVNDLSHFLWNVKDLKNVNSKVL